MSVRGGGANVLTDGAEYSGHWRRLRAHQEDRDGTYNGPGPMRMPANVTRSKLRAPLATRYVLGFRTLIAQEDGPGCQAGVRLSDDMATPAWTGTGTRPPWQGALPLYILRSQGVDATSED